MDSSWCDFLLDPCYGDINYSHPFDKEADDLLVEISKAFCDVRGDEEDGDMSVDLKGTRHGVGKVLKVPFNFDVPMDSTCKKYGTGKVFKFSDMYEDEDKESDFSIDTTTSKKYGMGKVLKIPNTHEDEDKEADFSIDTTTSKKHGMGKVLKIPNTHEDENEDGDKEDDFPMAVTCKKYGIGKVLRIPDTHDDHKYTFGQKLSDQKPVLQSKIHWRVEDLSKEEQYQSKMRATQAKLRQSYQKTLPTRHSIVLDIQDLPDLNKQSRAPAQTARPKRKLQNNCSSQQQQYNRRRLIL